MYSALIKVVSERSQAVCVLTYIYIYDINIHIYINICICKYIYYTYFTYIFILSILEYIFSSHFRSKGIAFVAIAVRLGATIAPFIILMV